MAAEMANDARVAQGTTATTEQTKSLPPTLPPVPMAITQEDFDKQLKSTKEALSSMALKYNTPADPRNPTKTLVERSTEINGRLDEMEKALFPDGKAADPKKAAQVVDYLKRVEEWAAKVDQAYPARKASEVVSLFREISPDPVLDAAAIIPSFGNGPCTAAAVEPKFSPYKNRKGLLNEAVEKSRSLEKAE